MLTHIDYPHTPGFMLDCYACEMGECQCTDSSSECASRVHAEIFLPKSAVILDIDDIEDAVAVSAEVGEASAALVRTIAALFQSPGLKGAPFASLASAGRCTWELLSDSVDYELSLATVDRDRELLTIMREWLDMWISD